MELLPLAFTSGRDGVSTVVRPVAGAVIGALLTGDVAGVTAFAMLDPVAAVVFVALLLQVGVWFTVAVMGRVRGWPTLRCWQQPA
jgi:hypothetical protein